MSFQGTDSSKFKTERIPQVVLFHNAVVTDPFKKAELFNSSFGTVFSIPSSTVTPSVIDVINPNILMSIEATDGEVETILKSSTCLNLKNRPRS